MSGAPARLTATVGQPPDWRAAPSQSDEWWVSPFPSNRTSKSEASVGRLGRFLGCAVLGAAWRSGFVFLGFAAATSGWHFPWLSWVALVGLGFVRGLWHRRWLLARVWRWSIVAAFVAYAAPSLPWYPQLVVAAFAGAAIASIVSVWGASRVARKSESASPITGTRETVLETQPGANGDPPYHRARASRKLLVLIAGLLLIVGCAAAYYFDAQLSDQVQAAVATGERWIAGALSRVRDATTILEATPTPKPPTAVPPAISSAPVTTPAPTAAPTPVPAAAATVWSTMDCSWASGILTQDISLDEQAETGYDDGAYAAYYAVTAAKWQRALGLAQGACARDGMAAAAAQASLADFASAIRAHQLDAQVRPQDRSWDATWIANYQRLTTLFDVYA